MNTRTVISSFMIILMFSCGPKTTKTKDVIVKETENYVSKMDANKNLKETTTDGALTDKEGFEDIGTFKYTIFFNENTNELYRIQNIEKTDKTVEETYYFKDNDLILVASESNKETSKIYIENGKVVSKTNATSEMEKLLLQKAKRFQKSFKQNP